MKFIIVTGFFASAADGALSTMRIGPKKAIRGHVDFEFGRPVDDVDVHEAFHEMKIIQRRFLQGGTSYGNEAGASFPLPGMSIPYPGMSLPYPGMSIPFPGMSLPQPGMSLPFPGMSLSHSNSIAPTVAPSANTAPTASNTEMLAH
ncbi:hypothetical protein MHU86_18700 [Fragilaria crotonensis]|nr:hypothetical protein MHU86_18700 [Fragilaria crotonensis]